VKTSGEVQECGSEALSLSPLLTAKEVAELLRCSKQAVYWWAETGVLPHVRIGRAVRFRRDDVERVMTSTEGSC
jgi:excisionase family DNA binding protein